MNGNGALVGSSEAPTDNLSKFYCKNNGVLYENDVIQIGVKTECRSNLARLALFYGNKTSSPFLVRYLIRLRLIIKIGAQHSMTDGSPHPPFQNFQPVVTCPPEAVSALQLQVKSVDSTVEAGAQFQQMVNVECVADFNVHPDLVSNRERSCI